MPPSRLAAFPLFRASVSVTTRWGEWSEFQMISSISPGQGHFLWRWGESNPLVAILLCLVRTYLPRSGCVFDPPLVAFHDHRWPVLRALGAPSRPFCALVGWFRSSFSRTRSVMIPYLRGIGTGWDPRVAQLSTRQLQLSPSRCSRVLGNTGLRRGHLPCLRQCDRCHHDTGPAGFHDVRRSRRRWAALRDRSSL